MAVGVVLALTGGVPASAVGAGADETACGEVAVAPSGSTSFYSLNRVSERATSCTAARHLVRAWALAAAAGSIPPSVISAVGPGNVVLINRPGRPYAFDGFTCRWTNTPPGRSAYQPGRADCRARAAAVTWTYRGASNPDLGPVTGCRKGVPWRHGDIDGVRVRVIGCRAAGRLLASALNHGVLRARGGTISVAHRVADGFHFSRHGLAFTARHGRARITFSVCWYDVDC